MPRFPNTTCVPIVHDCKKCNCKAFRGHQQPYVFWNTGSYICVCGHAKNCHH